MVDLQQRQIDTSEWHRTPAQWSVVIAYALTTVTLEKSSFWQSFRMSEPTIQSMISIAMKLLKN